MTSCSKWPSAPQKSLEVIAEEEEFARQPPTLTGQRFTPRQGDSLTLPGCARLSWEREVGVGQGKKWGQRHGGGVAQGHPLAG